MSIGRLYPAKPFIYILEPTAVKEHVCEHCSNTIQPASKYFRKKIMNAKHEFSEKKYCSLCYNRENI